MSTFVGFLGLIILGVIFWLALRVHRKGDFAFRIKKLQKRTAELISQIMSYESEADYFALYENPKEQMVINEVQKAIGEANAVAVDVSDHLAILLKRANGWFDFSDLYVEIGMQEERLEQAEGKFQNAWEKFKGLPKP